jgi:hypothetical protein
LVDRSLDETLAVGVLRDVALHRDRIGARRLAGRDDCLAAGLVARVVDHDVATARRQKLRAFRPDALVRARAGNDRCLALDVQQNLPP